MDENLIVHPSEKLVLLVDDDVSLLDLMEHVVKKEGFRTDRATDGIEATRKAKALNPDIILLDMMLPSMGGYEILRDLQASGFGDIPIIVVTGRQMDSQGVALIRLESNVKEFLEKPVRPMKIITALHRWLGTSPQMSPRREAEG